MFNLVVLIIVIAGSLNWLAIGAFQFDVIAGIFGSQSVFIARFCYTLIGLAGTWFLLLVTIKKGKIDLCKKKNNENKLNTKDEHQYNNEKEDNSKNEDDKDKSNNEDKDTKTLTKLKKNKSKDNKTQKE